MRDTSDGEDDPLAGFEAARLEGDFMSEPLDFEQQCYEQGLREGEALVDPEAFRDGELMGIQTGFQHFMLLGAMLPFVDDLTDMCKEREGTDARKNYARISDQLAALKNGLMDTFGVHSGAISVSNEPELVEKYNRTLKLARGKLITLATQLGVLDRFLELERIVKHSIGKTPENAIMGDDMDLW